MKNYFINIVLNTVLTVMYVLASNRLIDAYYICYEPMKTRFGDIYIFDAIIVFLILTLIDLKFKKLFKRIFLILCFLILVFFNLTIPKLLIFLVVFLVIGLKLILKKQQRLLKMK